MAYGTLLSTLRTMLRAEIGQTMDTAQSTSEDTRDNQLLANKQLWLADSHDWPVLENKWDLSVPAATRYIALPTAIIQGTSNVIININRPLEVNVLYAQRYLPVGWEIGEEEYNVWNSNLTPPFKADPLRKVQLTDATNIEVWPIPNTTQTLRFIGQKKLSALSADSDPALLDDYLIVLMTAVDILTALEHPMAQQKAQMAVSRMSQVRAGLPSRTDKIVLGKNNYYNRQNYRRIVPIAVAP